MIRPARAALALSFLALPSLSALAADVVLQCPADLHTTQAPAGALPPNWAARSEAVEGRVPGSARHALSGVTFSVGHPKEGAWQRPEVLKRQSGRPSLTRIILNVTDELHQTCTYGNTVVQLTQVVGTGFSQCETRWDLSTEPAAPLQTVCKRGKA